MTECGEGRGSNPTPARGRAPSPGRQAFAADCTDCRPACRSPLVVDGAVPAGSEGASCVVPLAARWFFFSRAASCWRRIERAFVVGRGVLTCSPTCAFCELSRRSIHHRHGRGIMVVPYLKLVRDGALANRRRSRKVFRDLPAMVRHGENARVASQRSKELYRLFP